MNLMDIKYQGICLGYVVLFKKPKGYVGVNSRKHWQKRFPARRLKLWVLKGKLWLTLTPISGAFRLDSDYIYTYISISILSKSMYIYI